jgi:hypothetical protein
MRRLVIALVVLALAPLGGLAQQSLLETRDPQQVQDEDFAKAYKAWTGEPIYGSPLVDHLPRVPGIPMPKDVLGYHIGAPRTLTYYADILQYYRALAAATPRVTIETIGTSDEGRELVVVWVSSDENIANLQANRDNLKRLADPRTLGDEEIRRLIATTKPHYHLMGGLHSGETGPSEMLMELVYRLAVETSPFISQIRDNVIVSVTPVADADGRDRNVDKFFCDQEFFGDAPPPQQVGTPPGSVGVGCPLPYWGRYVYHDNNRDINLSQVQMRAITDWYFTAHPPIMHDLHESLALLYTYSGAAPQNPNLDPLLFAELPWFSNWELAQMTKWGMPGVYTHAFMDGWSPGYLGSVAYNHNGMMRMYETQRGSDPRPPGAATTAAREGGAARGDAAGRGRGEGAARGRGTPPAAGQPGQPAQAPPATAAATPAGAQPGGRGPAVPTGRGGGQPREWYRGIPVPPGMPANFTRRNNTNYMQTGVLSALQLTSMFPNLVIENFYVKTRNSIASGLNAPPHGYVIPVQRDMTRPAELVRILRLQGIEVGTANAAITIGDATYPAGSYVIKAGQPYWRLAKNLLEKQDFPDPALRTYDDSGWTMGLAFNVDVKEIRDKAILEAPTTLVADVAARGRVAGTGTAALAVAHFGSNNMITLRYQLRDVPMRIAQEPFKAGGMDFPAGSFIISGAGAGLDAARAAVESLGLTAAALETAPPVPSHDADPPRVAIYTQWSQTQELGWYRHAFDRFGIPFDLIYKERVLQGNLKADYDVIVMAAQNITRAAVMAPKSAKPQPYMQSREYKYLGMYGETPDASGGFGEEGVAAFGAFLEAGGTLITAHNASRFPVEFGFARSVDIETFPQTALNAQKPLVHAEIVRTDHPVFYGYDTAVIPVKFGQGQFVFRTGPADADKVLIRFQGGADSVLSGLMVGADQIRNRAFGVDIPRAHNGRGRVIMFASNPVYRWQNHGEFNMIFNAILNWNDSPAPAASTTQAPGIQSW